MGYDAVNTGHLSPAMSLLPWVTNDWCIRAGGPLGRDVDNPSLL